MGILSGLGITKTGSHKAAEKRYRDEHGQELLRRQQLEGQAGEARNKFMAGLDAFDPAEYARQTAEGLGGQLNEGLIATQAASAQQLNQRGFYGGGINKARITRDFSDRIANALSALGMEAGGMELSRLQGYGDVYDLDANRVEHARGQELDVLADVVGMHQDDRQSKLGATGNLVGAGSKFVGGL